MASFTTWLSLTVVRRLIALSTNACTSFRAWSSSPMEDCHLSSKCWSFMHCFLLHLRSEGVKTITRQYVALHGCENEGTIVALQGWFDAYLCGTESPASIDWQVHLCNKCIMRSMTNQPVPVNLLPCPNYCVPKCLKLKHAFLTFCMRPCSWFVFRTSSIKNLNNWSDFLNNEVIIYLHVLVLGTSQKFVQRRSHTRGSRVEILSGLWEPRHSVFISLLNSSILTLQ